MIFPAITSRLAHLVVVLVAALVTSGCGTSDRATPATSTNERSTATAPVEAADTEGDGDEDDIVTPTAASLAYDRRTGQLVAAYAPVSDRVNFLVTAETLRADAVEAGAGEAVELERAGAARVEARRLLGVLVVARPKVAVVKLAGVDEEQVRDLMLAAIDSRIAALREFQVALAALGSDDIGDTERDALVDQWRATWDESVKYAREATTAMQDDRARLGLEAAPEESVR